MSISKEEFDELLELRKKANIVPKTNWRFERLEYLLTCMYGLDSFTKEEKDKLMEEFKNLSPEDQHSVVYNAQYKTSPACFYLKYEEAEKLGKARKKLSLHERAQLSDGFSIVFGGLAWLDLGEMFEAEIQIDDHSSPQRESKPYAHLYFSDGYNRRVETVDIIASVEQDAQAIGHPAIVAAIRYWQEIVYSKNVHNTLDRDDDEPIMKSLRDYHSRRHIENAEKNLEALSRALIKGAHNQSLNRKEAIVVTLQGLDLDNPENTLYLAWQLLKDCSFADDPNLERFEKLLDEERKKYSDTQKSPLRFPTVMRFLKDKDENGGYKKFVEAKKNPSWEKFRNAFAAWYMGISVGTVKPYLSKGKNLKTKVPISKGFSGRAFVYPKSSITGLLLSVLSEPLVFAREPVWISENNLGLSIEDAISEKPEKTTKSVV